VHYDHTWLTGILKFTAGDVSSAVLDEGQTSLSVPFTFFGELANFDSYASLVADPDGALFFADHIDYDFAPVPTPEPTTLLLVGTGGAGLLARRRARRNLDG
jgi:hypothetical protein